MKNNHSADSVCVCPNCKPELFAPEDLENNKILNERIEFIESVLNTTDLVKALCVPILQTRITNQALSVILMEYEISISEADIKLILAMNAKMIDNKTPEDNRNRINLENKIKECQAKIQTARQYLSGLEDMLIKESAAIERVKKLEVPTFNGIPLPIVTVDPKHKIH